MTKLADLINPEVMADMISAKIENAIKVLPYAKVDTTLQGQAGDTITVPKFSYIGDAVTVAEGADIPIRTLEGTSVQYEIKKIGTGVVLTDEAVLSGYGNPVGEATNQLSKSVLSATDTDGIEALYEATTTVTGVGTMSYKNVVNGVDAFNEEGNTEKALFVHPHQVTQLRLDPNFISADKYDNSVMMKGEIGLIANCRVVPSRKVKKDDAGENFINPIVKLTQNSETEDESPALTVYLKRDTNVESFRNSGNRTTEITVDKLYTVALTNEEKVVLLTTAVEQV
ncbi:N4-gp56 family major capsid protein [Eubacteriales bacterium OttesenSCG-928-M02]|nr:N4-gp56 family major capsid protein [Eubacteriales bacterium OttesenSCG-928-M02]